MDIVLRKWNKEDAPALSLLLDGIDRRYLSDRLPHPYTLADGEQWLDMVLKQEGKAGIFRAVMVDGELAGSISVEQKSDIYRRDAEIGYLLAAGYWSKGIMTEAVRQTPHHRPCLRAQHRLPAGAGEERLCAGGAYEKCHNQGRQYLRPMHLREADIEIGGEHYE